MTPAASPPRVPLRLLAAMLRNPTPALDEVRARYGSVCLAGRGPLRIAVVGEPAAIAALHGLPVSSFRWNHRLNVVGFFVGPRSLIVSDGPDHRRRRGALMPALARRRLDTWVPMIVEETDRTVDTLVAAGAGPPVDLTPAMRALVLAVVVRSMFGEHLASRAGEVGALLEHPQAYLESPAVRQIPHPFPRTRRARVRADRQALDAIIDEEISRRREDAGDAPDLLTALVGSGELSDAEIRDQVVSMIGAGFDTTSAALIWTLWRATLTPGLWDRLRAEADQVLGSGAVDHLALARLDLARRTVREALRLHPPSAGGVREAVVDVEVGGYRIPRGTIILWSSYLAGRDESSWERPGEFDPDRFLAASDEQLALAERAWVPFGGGARSCIGAALAQMELVLALARLAQRLDLVPAATEVPSAVGLVVSRPDGGAPMRVRARAPA